MSRTFAIACLTASVGVAAPVMRAFASAPERSAASCSAVAPRIATRNVIPAGFPLPAGVRFTWIERNAAGTTLVGFAPRTFSKTVSFFRRTLRSTWTDAEFGEAEARFVSPLFAGQWRVNTIAGCDRASVVTLSFSSRTNRSATGRDR
jgi:hypothetical protein